MTKQNRLNGNHLTVPQELKIDLLANWLKLEWMSEHETTTWRILSTPVCFVDDEILTKFDRELELPNGYHFVDYRLEECELVTQVNEYSNEGVLKRRTGAFTHQFRHAETGAEVRVLVVSAYTDDDYYDKVMLACVPEDFTETWIAFVKECWRLPLSPRVEIIGGAADSFVPKVDWEDIILPEDLKSSIFEDVQSFFTKGVEVYRRLNLKPFRKLLLAGIPGTGKTMLCTALAKWALEHDYLVIYVSSADREGASFSKIQQALAVASRSNYPTLIILEELDAYLHKEEKALVLNTLDGSESLENEKGTLLIATTNYPEAVDERVLKRPGRLDRIFIVPEIQNRSDAERMLEHYLGSMWQEEHAKLAPRLVGYQGAFIREVAIYALTQVAYDDMENLPYEMLRDSFDRLKEQIDTKDEFLKKRAKLGFNLTD